MKPCNVVSNYQTMACQLLSASIHPRFQAWMLAQLYVAICYDVLLFNINENYGAFRSKLVAVNDVSGLTQGQAYLG